MAVVEPVRSVLRPFGGVGGLPVEGFKEISLVASSRGLRNMALRGGGRHGPSVDRVVTSEERGFRDIVFTRGPVTTLLYTDIYTYHREMEIGSKAFAV